MGLSKRTLENPLLYRNFLKTIERNNPDIDIDPDTIDRTLEPDEDLNELKSFYPGLKLSGKDKSEMEQFRDYLNEDFGIDERRIQNLIIADPKQPFTNDELAGISGAIHTRSDHAVSVDKGKKAKTITRDTRRWSRSPNRLDIQGIDTPALSNHDKARIDILAKLNTCSGQKRGCGDPAERLKALEATGRYDKRDLDAAFEAAKEAGYFDNS
jgi:hypothetical protein